MWHLLRTHIPMGNLLNAYTFNETILAWRLKVRELKRLHYKRIERRSPPEFQWGEWRDIMLENLLWRKWKQQDSTITCE